MCAERYENEIKELNTKINEATEAVETLRSMNKPALALALATAEKEVAEKKATLAGLVEKLEKCKAEAVETAKRQLEAHNRNAKWFSSVARACELAGLEVRPGTERISVKVGGDRDVDIVIESYYPGDSGSFYSRRSAPASYRMLVSFPYSVNMKDRRFPVKADGTLNTDKIVKAIKEARDILRAREENKKAAKAALLSDEATVQEAINEIGLVAKAKTEMQYSRHGYGKSTGWEVKTVEIATNDDEPKHLATVTSVKDGEFSVCLSAKVDAAKLAALLTLINS